jgi:predicted acylesterase/phospholipase RssA
MPLMTSLRISCNIPLLFQAVQFENEYYVDGGLYDIFPYEHAKTLSASDEDVIGICVQSFKTPAPIENIRDFLYNFSLSIIETLINNTHYRNDTNVYTIDTSGIGVDIVSFLDTKIEKRKLVLQHLLQEGSHQCERTHLKRSLSDD